MENLTVTENSTWSENASVAVISDGVLPCSLGYFADAMIKLNLIQFEAFIRSAFTSVFIIQIIKPYRSAYNGLRFLVLILSIHAAINEDFDIQLCFFWCCYPIIFQLIKRTPWIGCLVLYAIASILAVSAPSYFTLLTLFANILFISTMCHLIHTGYRRRSINLLRDIRIICCLAGLFNAISRTPDPNVHDMIVIFWMFESVIDFAFQLRRSGFAYNIVIFYCLHKKMDMFRLAKHEESH